MCIIIRNFPMSHSQTLFKKPKAVLRKVEAFCHEENERARMGSGLHFPQQSSNATFRCLSASPFAKSDKDSETSGSQQDDEDCGLVMSFASSSSPVCVPCYRYHGFQSNGSPVALRSLPRFLPPIGVFWDIENCQVPKGRSAMAVAQVIRDRFFNGYREAEFLVVCDVKKENSQVIQELNDAQVNLIHVSATCKNAADEKLRQAIRRFADIHGSPASIILISGDINFAADICDLRHRKKIHVILLHKVNTSEALILCASENYNFTHIVESLPPRTQSKFPNQPVEIIISNLPDDKDQARVRNRLKQLSDNCGGRVGSIYKNSASIRFSSMEIANRAKKRMDGEDVFGNKISVGSPTRGLEKKEGSPVKSSAMRKILGRRDEVIKDVKSYGKFNESTKEAKSTDQNGWQSCPNVSWLSEKEVEDDSLGRLRGLPSNTVNPCDALGPLPPPTLSAIHPPPQLWHTVPSHWINGSNAESHKSEVVEFSSSKDDSEGSGSLPKTVADKSSESWLPNKLPDGRRKIRGTHRVAQSKELEEDLDPLRNAETVMFNTNMGNESTHYSSSGHLQSFTNSKKSRTPSPLGSNGSVDTQMHQIRSVKCFPSSSSKSSQKYSSNEMHIPKFSTPSPLTVSLSSQDREIWSQSNVTTWVSGSNSWQSERHSCSPVSSLKTTDSDMAECYFHPIQSVQTVTNENSVSALASINATSPVELLVTNLDQDIDAKDLKRILLLVFREHVIVLHVALFIQSDGNFAASVKLPSLQDAQYAISQLHRRRVGHKRICISYAHSSGPKPQLIRSQIVSLLLEVPGHRLPLFKFRELFESRYLTSVSVSDLHRMKDVILVTEDSTGRMVSLNTDHRNSPSPVNSTDGQLADYPYCMIHSKKPKPDKGWAEQEIDALPNLMIGIKLFGQRIHKLLHSHNGTIPLLSLPNCYLAEFKELETDEEGVPVEHLVAYVPGVEIYQGSSGAKLIRWQKNSSSNSVYNGESLKCVSPPLVAQLTLFGREFVDLLKTAPHCQLPFNRFIPAYHHHFGRQCRVADYGFTKLIDLLEALPQVVQVMGDGSRRTITLSHKAQVRRFTSDLLRILKSQANKQIALSAFSSVYKKVIGRSFHAPDYGVCYLEDILAEIPENTVVVSTVTDDSTSSIIISVPKREQTPNEIEKTKQFSLEVVELLRHASQYSLLFNKFIPAYHHHFGHQCRVSDYGFTKLIELFEAIPEVVKIEETSEGERRVTLTVAERLKVVAEQMVSLVQSSGWASNHYQKLQKGSNQTRSSSLQGPPPPLLPLSAIPTAFLRMNGYALHYEDFDCDSLEQLMQCISNAVEVLDSPWGSLLSVVDRGAVHRLELQVRCMLLNTPNGKKYLKDFVSEFHWIYPNQTCNIDLIRRELTNVVQIVTEEEMEVIALTPLELFGQEILILLGEMPGERMRLSSLETAYLEHFGVAACPAKLGFPSLLPALHALQKTISIRGRGYKRTIFVNSELINAGLVLPLEIVNHHVDSNKTKEGCSTNFMDSAVISKNDSSYEVQHPDNSPVQHDELDATVCAPHQIGSEEEVQQGQADSSPKLPQTSFVWPQFPSPFIQASIPSPPLNVAASPQPLSLSCSLITSCPVVPPDPSELPLPLLGLSRNCENPPHTPPVVTSTCNSENTASINDESPSLNQSGSGNPVGRRMKMKAQFDSPLLLP